MHFAPPTSHTDVPCAVPNFTGIPAVTANPHPRYRLLPSRYGPLQSWSRVNIGHYQVVIVHYSISYVFSQNQSYVPNNRTEITQYEGKI